MWVLISSTCLQNLSQLFVLIVYYDWFNICFIIVVDKYKDQQQCSDSTPIVIGVVLSIVIVISIVINFICWRKKIGKQFSLGFFLTITD